MLIIDQLDRSKPAADLAQTISHTCENNRQKRHYRPTSVRRRSLPTVPATEARCVVQGRHGTRLLQRESRLPASRDRGLFCSWPAE
jgi:hypothetical protein